MEGVCYTGTNMPNGGSTSKNQTLGLLVALSILMAVGVFVIYLKMDISNTLVSDHAVQISSQLTQMEKHLNALEMTSGMQKPTSRVLATSPDGKFTLRGEGICDGVYQVGDPELASLGTDKNLSYELLFRAQSTVLRSVGNQYDTLGNVAIELDKGPFEIMYSKFAFSEGRNTVSYVISGAPKVEDCLFTITPQ